MSGALLTDSSQGARFVPSRMVVKKASPGLIASANDDSPGHFLKGPTVPPLEQSERDDRSSEVQPLNDREHVETDKGTDIIDPFEKGSHKARVTIRDEANSRTLITVIVDTSTGTNLIRRSSLRPE